MPGGSPAGQLAEGATFLQGLHDFNGLCLNSRWNVYDLGSLFSREE